MLKCTSIVFIIITTTQSSFLSDEIEKQQKSRMSERVTS